eukprot:Rmarinus@m.27430
MTVDEEFVTKLHAMLRTFVGVRYDVGEELAEKYCTGPLLEKIAELLLEDDPCSFIGLELIATMAQFTGTHQMIEKSPVFDVVCGMVRGHHGFLIHECLTLAMALSYTPSMARALVSAGLVRVCTTKLLATPATPDTLICRELVLDLLNGCLQSYETGTLKMLRQCGTEASLQKLLQIDSLPMAQRRAAETILAAIHA